MSDPEAELEEESIEESIISPVAETAMTELTARAKTAGLSLEKVAESDDAMALMLGMKCGRDSRAIYLRSDKMIRELLSFPFERFVFLSGFEAICSYQDGIIEAAIRPAGIGFMPVGIVYRRLFGLEGQQWDDFDVEKVKLIVDPPRSDLPRIEISPASEVFTFLIRTPTRYRLTLKLSGCAVATHDDAALLMMQVAGSLFFQIDLLSNVPLSLQREHRRFPPARRQRRRVNLAGDLQYPKTEFDDAPLSLYWYARSAAGMPLLQFLAFYQVIEFYFPTYSEAEAQRKLKAILKDPTFRGDRDADIGKLLAAIRVSRGGSLGDERSQLRATLAACVAPEGLRTFLESDADRKEFYTAKSKSRSYHKIPLANTATDLRTDVADRMYDIRCKIVHTKNDSGDGEFELLLPFSKEAERLFHDIELVQFLAKAVLIAGSSPFRSGG